MVDSIIIITKTLARYLYGPNTYDVTDLKKRRDVSIPSKMT